MKLFNLFLDLDTLLENLGPKFIVLKHLVKNVMGGGRPAGRPGLRRHKVWHFNCNNG